MKNIEVVGLNKVLGEVSFKEVVSGKLQYAIGRNRIKIAHQVDMLAKIKAGLAPEGYEELLSEIRGIIQEAVAGKTEAEYTEINRKCIEDWEKNKEWTEITTAYDAVIYDLYEQDSALELYKIDEELINSLALTEGQVAVILMLNEYAATLAV